MTPELQEVPPKYLQIAGHFRQQIVAGDLSPGEELPSERQLAADWGVSRPTVTRALSVLRAEGLVDARQGAGTFVRAQPQLHRRARDRYARSRQTGRIYAGDERSEIVSADFWPAPEEVAAALGIEAAVPAIRRHRIVYERDEPVETSVSWFDRGLADHAPRLLERSRIREGTLAYIERSTARRGRSAIDRLMARLATAEEAADLRLDGGPRAVLVVHHTTFDAGGVPIEFVVAVFPPGRWSFEQEYPISA